MKTRILWSGITGRTGKSAVIAAKDCNYAEIVAGICRKSDKNYNYDELDAIREQFDVIVDFSHSDSFDKILSFAMKVKKPLVVGTAGLSEQQSEAITKSCENIPIFIGGNFRFSVQEFADKVVEHAKRSDDEILIKETLYKTKREVPSGTAKQLAQKILDETGKTASVESFLENDDLICEWKVADIRCRIGGFDELAKDVFRIAKMMSDKKPGGVYNLDRLIKEP